MCENLRQMKKFAVSCCDSIRLLTRTFSEGVSTVDNVRRLGAAPSPLTECV